VFDYSRLRTILSRETIVQPLSQLWLRCALRSPQQDARFRAVSADYAAVCARLLGESSGSSSRTEGYDWTSFSHAVRRALEPRVPINFLRLRVLRRTMVFGSSRGIAATTKRVAIVENVFGQAVARQLLAEDWIGSPSITEGTHLTSANRAHHAAHLAAYQRVIGTPLWEARHVLEWGGGYGNMARLVRRMNPRLTYTIIDLAELLALQYVYLAAVEGSRPNVIGADDPLDLHEGAVNLVSSVRIAAAPTSVRGDAFLSTWAITESPKEAQRLALGHAFFGARRILMASKLDGNNIMAGRLPRDITREPIGNDMGIGPEHEYWFR